MTVIRFRWVFCQLETLQQCLPQCVRRTLDELPESLDETYERVIMEIKRTNQVHAYRMLQCLTVASRPLSVAELAELLAFDFDVPHGGIPKLNSDWRWEDHEQAVLSTCSSLITVLPGHGSPIVQFSHFSVKEFLTSDRLAKSTKDISRYHISLSDAHMVLAQACLGVLLSDLDVDHDANCVPLARYAAEHWVAHAQVEDVASRVFDGMKYLFDPDKPHFEAWVQLHDVDAHAYGRIIFPNRPDPDPGARSTSYAALCGFHEIVEHLTLKYPQYASVRGCRCGTALHSASFGGHLKTVRYLLEQGVGVDVRDTTSDTPLLCATWGGHSDIVQCLLEHGADADFQNFTQNTPLSLAVSRGHVDIVRVLLEHNAEVNSHDNRGDTALHLAIRGIGSKDDCPHFVRLLLEHGANASARNAEHRTPLHLVSMDYWSLDVARILLEHGADIDAEDKEGRTPLQVASVGGQGKIVRLLSDYRSGRAQT